MASIKATRMILYAYIFQLCQSYITALAPTDSASTFPLKPLNIKMTFHTLWCSIYFISTSDEQYSKLRQQQHMGQLEARACICRRNLPRSQENSSKYGKFLIRLDVSQELQIFSRCFHPHTPKEKSTNKVFLKAVGDKAQSRVIKNITAVQDKKI